MQSPLFSFLQELFGVHLRVHASTYTPKQLEQVELVMSAAITNKAKSYTHFSKIVTQEKVNKPKLNRL